MSWNWLFDDACAQPLCHSLSLKLIGVVVAVVIVAVPMNVENEIARKHFKTVLRISSRQLLESHVVSSRPIKRD